MVTVDDYGHHWYTWVILIAAAVFIGISCLVGYYKYYGHCLCLRFSNERGDNILLSDQEKKGLLNDSDSMKKRNNNSNLKSSYDYYGSQNSTSVRRKPLFGHYSESTDMIPDTPNGYANTYQYLHESWKSLSKSFLKQITDKKVNNIDSNGNGNSNANSNEKDMNDDSNKETENGDENREPELGSVVSIKVDNNGKESQLEPILENKGENTSYESFHADPFVENGNGNGNGSKNGIKNDVTNSISNVESTNNGSNNGNNTNNKSNRLFRVKMEGHSLRKIPFMSKNNYFGHSNNSIKYDSSSDSGVRTDDLDSDNDSSGHDVLGSEVIHGYENSLDSYDEASPDEYL